MSEYIGNRYQVLKLLGRGGMADVYLAYDVILKREVAVKVLKADMSSDEMALERFKREAGAVTQLSHPNIVDVYDVGDDGDKHYIVMEYVKGYTLKQLIRKRGPIPYKEAVWLMKQLAGALMEAHRNNVIHRDVKSQNVLIKDDGTVKLSDFGIALASGAMQITHKDSVLGSVHYLAPELAQGKQATMQSDIYSLGIVFFELLTGDVPYKADNAIQVALQHIKGTIPGVREFDPNIPQSVENIVIRATAKNPAKRYRNIALMLQDLNECLKKEHLNDRKIVLDQAETKNGNSSVHVSDVANEEGRKGRSPLSAIFLVSITLISILAVAGVLLLSGILNPKNKTVIVPELRNRTVQEARDLLAQLDLEVDDSRITWTLSDDVEKDLIISSNPSSGEEVDTGSKIKLTVSNGKYGVLDTYVGWDYKDAQTDLRNKNFIVKLLPVEQEGKSGTVLEQSMEAGSKYDPTKNNEITLKYISEPSFILDYGLRGMSLGDAMKYFEQNNIKYELIQKDKSYFTEEELKDVHSGTVVKTLPELGTVYSISSGETVQVYYYSRGAEE